MAKHLQTGSLKTINGTSLEGTGDIVITGGSGTGVGSTELPPYSTSEVLTSERWIDGKPIYRKVFTVNSLTNTEQYIDTGLLVSAINIVKEEGVVKLSNGNIVDCSYSIVNVYTNTIATNIRIAYSITVGGTNLQYTLTYTKTTDTAASPVALVGSSQNITTGVEYIVPKTIDGKQVYGMRVDCGYLPNNSIKAISIPNYNSAYSYSINFGESHAHGASNFDLPLNFYYSPTQYILAYVENSNIKIKNTEASWVNNIAYVTLHYTK